MLLNVSMVNNRDTQGQHRRRIRQALNQARARPRSAIRAANEIWLSPPLTMDKATVDEMLQILDDGDGGEDEFPYEA